MGDELEDIARISVLFIMIALVITIMFSIIGATRKTVNDATGMLIEKTTTSGRDTEDIVGLQIVEEGEGIGSTKDFHAHIIRGIPQSSDPIPTIPLYVIVGITLFAVICGWSLFAIQRNNSDSIATKQANANIGEIDYGLILSDRHFSCRVRITDYSKFIEVFQENSRNGTESEIETYILSTLSKRLSNLYSAYRLGRYANEELDLAEAGKYLKKGANEELSSYYLKLTKMKIT